jgi:ubiquinone biosynthesis protein
MNTDSNNPDNNDYLLKEVNTPGALPFIDPSPQNFAEVVAESRNISSLGWIVMSPAGPLVVGYKQIKSILRDPDWISLLAGFSILDGIDSVSNNLNTLLLQAQKIIPEVPSTVKLRPNVLSVEGQDHKRLRRLVNSAFTSGNTDRHRSFMKNHATQLIKEISENGKGELVHEFCRPYPVPVICRILGADDSDWKLFDHWADIIFSALDADIEAVIGKLGEINVAQRELDEYVQNLINQRLSKPEDDLISELVQGHFTEDRLTHDELCAMVEAILLAGTDTTRNQLGAMLAVLADHPEQYAAIRNDHSLIPTAVEESLRYISAVRTTGRLAAKDLVVDDIFFPAGSTVLLGLHAGGLSDADDDGYIFNIFRETSSPHLAFGSGAHHCLGASLARAELQEALLAFVEAIPAFEITSPIIWKPLSMGIWGPEEVQIKVLAEASDDIDNQNFVSTKVDDSNPISSMAQSSQDSWIHDAAISREKLRLSIPDLIRKPKLPPIGRLLITVWRFSSAFISWKLFDRKGEKSIQSEALYRRLRKAAEKQGPTYVKLAQLISAAEGVFPDSLVNECKKCRDQVTPEKWSRIKRVLEQNIGSISIHFQEFNKEPLAAASIAQVHEAQLHDGTSVVVKIQRPDIRSHITNDLKVMAWIAPKLVGRIPISALTNPPALVELFAETICEELDFQLEVANLFELNRVLKTNKNQTWELPIPNLELVTGKVIVMSKVSGIPLGEALTLDMNPERVSKIFRQMVDGLLEGAVIHGIFHGDFHAGNVFLNETDSIGLVDFGITGRLLGDRRLAFLRYVVGLMTGDVESQVIGIRDLGAFPQTLDVRTIISKFQLDREDFDPLELTEEEFIAEFRGLIKELLAHGARIPKELMLFVKNFAYLSSVVQELDPEMDLLQEFVEVASGFFARNGARVATEIGFSMSENDVSDLSLRRVAGLRSDVSTLTWKELGDRRSSILKRIDPQSIRDIKS